MGNVYTALASNSILRVRLTINPVPQRYHSIPDTPFILPKQKAKPASKNPAIIRTIQFILFYLQRKCGPNAIELALNCRCDAFLL